jgi:hypothetical protein
MIVLFSKVMYCKFGFLGACDFVNVLQPNLDFVQNQYEIPKQEQFLYKWGLPDKKKKKLDKTTKEMEV